MCVHKNQSITGSISLPNSNVVYPRINKLWLCVWEGDLKLVSLLFQSLETCASMSGLINLPMSNEKPFGVVTHICSLSNQKVEVGGSWDLGQTGLDSESENSSVYMKRPFLKITRAGAVDQWQSACLACGRPGFEDSYHCTLVNRFSTMRCC